jgi:TolB-like protein
LNQLFQELKRRNVFRVAIAYLAVAWLIIQIADVVLDNIAAPDWVMQALMFFLAIGFPIAVLFAWAYEMTPEGIKRESEVDRDTSMTPQTGKKLNRMIIAVLVAAVAVLLVDKFMLRESVPEDVVTDKSVAVLPFVAMSSGPDDEFFADGLTEEILNSLTRVPELLVTARTSAFHFKGQDIPVPDIAEQLGVAHIVEGSVRRAGEQMRVTVQLIRAEDGFHLWSESYDRQTADTFGVQTDIAEKIASALNVVLDDDQLAAMRASGIRNPEAFIELQKGRALFFEAHGGNQLETLERANRHLERVLELEPRSSLAYVLHSDHYVHLLIEAAADRETSVEAIAEAGEQMQADLRNAIRYAPDDATRRGIMYDMALLTGEWRGIVPLFDEIARDTTCYSPGWANMTTVAFGQAEQAARVMQRMNECDPLDFGNWMILVEAQSALGDFEAAIDSARTGLQADSHPLIRQELLNAFLGARRFDEAEALVNNEIINESWKLKSRIKVAAAQGDKDATRTLFEQYLAADLEGDEDVIYIAAIAGDRESANEYAARADANPFGFLLLMQIPSSCHCGAPWDIEVTPNFARMLEDAELPWPPVSAIDWPLKDW